MRASRGSAAGGAPRAPRARERRAAPRSRASSISRRKTSAVACASGSARWHGWTETPKKYESEARLVRCDPAAEQVAGQRHGVDHGCVKPLAGHPLELAVDEADVEARVVRDEHCAAGELREPPQRQPDAAARRAAPRRRARSGAPIGRGSGIPRRDERLEAVARSRAADPHGADLADPGRGLGEPGRLEVEDDEVARRDQRVGRGRERDERPAPARRASPRRAARAAAARAPRAPAARRRGARPPRSRERGRRAPREARPTGRASRSRAAPARSYTNICSITCGRSSPARTQSRRSRSRRRSAGRSRR